MALFAGCLVIGGAAAIMPTTPSVAEVPKADPLVLANWTPRRQPGVASTVTCWPASIGAEAGGHAI